MAKEPPGQRSPIAEPQPLASTARPGIPLTRLLTATLVVAYLLQLACGWKESNPNLGLAILLGANFGPLVWVGELDRLVTANWLHGYWFHLGLNALGLFVLGRGVEQLLGSRRFLIIYLVACLGGAGASALSTLDMPSMGASTGVVGLFAALGVILFGLRSRLPARTAKLRRSWLTVLALQVALEVLLETPLSPLPGVRIDHAGHLGGFFAGGVATLVLLGSATADDGQRRGRSNIVLAILLAVFVAAFGRAATRYATDDRSGMLTVLRHASQRALPPGVQNVYAWEVALDPNASAAMLAEAEKLARRAVEQHRNRDDISDSEPAIQGWWIERAAIADTHATLLFRQGQYQRAIALEVAARNAPVALPPELEASMDSQLARFLRAQLEEAPDGGEAPLPEVSWRGSRVFLADASSGPLEVLAVVGNDAAPLLGLLRLRVPVGQEAPRAFPLGGPEGERNVRIGWTSREPFVMNVVRPTASWTPMDPEVERYP